MTVDYERLAKVALMGALTAVAADFIHTNYGGEFDSLLTQFSSFLADLLHTTDNTGGTPA